MERFERRFPEIAQTMPKIVYPDAGEHLEKELSEASRQRLDALGGLVVHYGRAESDEAYVRRIGDARAILLGWDLPAEVMLAAPALELVVFTGIGAARFVDLPKAAAKGITVCNCPGYSDNTVAEHALALLLAAARHLPRLDADLRAGRWNQTTMGMELRGRRVGVVGFGGIGRRFAALAQAIGMEVMAWTRNPDPERARAAGVEFVSLERLLAECDVVSLHVAGTPETEGMIDAAAIARMKGSAVLVNTARGELVDEGALVEALRSGRIRAAGIDVYREEPLPPSHPFLELDNVVLSPHVGYNTPEATIALHDIAVECVVRYFAGDPVNVVAAPA